MTKRTLFALFLVSLTFSCWSQNSTLVSEYEAFVNGKKTNILLYSDSTYDFTTHWGSYSGKWQINANDDNGLGDYLFLDDDLFVTESAFFFAHISLDDSSNECFVTMYDITGDVVPYYSVCFRDSNNLIIECDYNSGRIYTHNIPPNTHWIGMVGDKRNLSSYFRCRYSPNEGSIAFIIGPSYDRFVISNDRDTIYYRPCYCDSHATQCAVAYKRKCCFND